MPYTIKYTDPSGSMIASNNPSGYDYSVEGIIPLSAPTITHGEFRGWFLNYSGGSYSNRISQLDNNISRNTTIYAYVQTITQLQILGSSIPTIENFNNGSPYLLFTTGVGTDNTRSLQAMTPQNYSKLVSGEVAYIFATTNSITTNLESVRQEYFIDVGSNTNLAISVTSEGYSSAKYLIFHLTRGTGNQLSNATFNVSISGPLSGTYSVNVGSTIILSRPSTSDDWVASVYLNPEFTEVVTEITDSLLATRNYVSTGNVTFSPNRSDPYYGGRLWIDVNLTGLDLSAFPSNVTYKSVFIQFNTSAYEASGADIQTLNKKQGYLNLIDVQPATLTYDTSSNEWVLKLTYDYIPAYSAETLNAYTQNIPIKIMVVI